MSGIYIKDVKLPDDKPGAFAAIVLYVDKDGQLRATGTHQMEVIPVPDHGPLIDADELTDAIESTDWYHQAPNKEMVHGANSAEHQAWYKEQDIFSAIENTLTIIPADEEVEE